MQGLKYIADFIDPATQDGLISLIDEQPWLTDLKRRTQHYGYKYDYFKKTVDSTLYFGPLPLWIAPLTIKLVADGLFTELPDQMIVNEYLPGQGIGRHTDCTTCFKDTIASLSLLSTCSMEFEHLKSDKKGSMMLAPLSLLVLSGEARYDWMHSIPARSGDKMNDEIIPRSRRVSLTFRNVIL